MLKFRPKKKKRQYVDTFSKNSPYHGNTAYNSSSSIYRKWGDLQSIYLKRRYWELYNRLCSMLSSFFSLSSYFTENIVRLNYNNHFFRLHCVPRRQHYSKYGVSDILSNWSKISLKCDRSESLCCIRNEQTDRRE